MAFLIPDLPMTGTSLKKALDELRDYTVPHVASLADMQLLDNLVVGDRCNTPQGVYTVVDDHAGQVAGITVVALAQAGLQAVLEAEAALPDAASVLADTRLPGRFATGTVLVAKDTGIAYEVVQASASDFDLTTPGGTKLNVLPGTRGIDVRAFGAVGDGATDDSAAFSAAFTVAAKRRFSPSAGSNPVTPRGIFVPGGEYRIATARALMGPAGFGRIEGMTWEGESGGTTIHFDFDGDDYLIYNDNEFLRLTFRNLRFTCASDVSKFWYSVANGGAQDVVFDRCTWDGTWQKLCVLRGVNNNSEMRWNDCAITATIRDTVLDIDDSDQFLNYWFVNCKLWLFDGQMLRAAKGGHFHFLNCDWSGLTPGMTLNQSTHGAPLFELLGRNHARGVCSLSVVNGRFEHK